MFAVIVFIFLGIAVGRLIRDRYKKWLSTTTTMLVWLLLFFMGIEVGSDKRIMQSLPELGLEAFAIALFATMGSSIGAWLLWRHICRNGGTSK